MPDSLALSLPPRSAGGLADPAGDDRLRNLRKLLAVLQGEKTIQSLRSLVGIWDVSEEEARPAENLVEIGFLERGGVKDNPAYWVPLLCRPAREMVQGSAARHDGPGEG